MPPRASQQRRDVALLKRLKDGSANPSGNFSPAALLGDGSALLDKASKIKSFLHGQRQRTQTSSATTFLLLASQQLENERKAAERDLQAAILKLVQLNDADTDLQMWAKQALSDSQQYEQQQLALSSQLCSSTRKLWRSIKNTAWNKQPKESMQRQQIQQELRSLLQGCQHQAGLLAAEAEQINAELQQCWPSAMPSVNANWNCPQPCMGDVHQDQRPTATEQDIGGPDTRTSMPQTPPPAAAGTWHRDMALLDDIVTRHPLAEDTVKARIRMVYGALQQAHMDKLQQWHAEASAVGADTPTATGGWSEDEHSLFVTLRQRCWKDFAATATPASQSGGTAGRDALMRQLAVLMPSRSIQQLLDHDDWLTTHKLMQRKRRGLMDAWARERTAFLEDSAELLKESHDRMIATAALAANRLAHELARECANNNFEDMKVIATEEAAVLEQMRLEQEVLDQERRAAEQTLAAAAAAYNKSIIAQYRAGLHDKLQEDARLAEEANRQLASERAASIAANKGRVDMRQAEHQAKQDKLKEAAIAAKMEEEAKQDRLARLRALVAPDVPDNPYRLFQMTESVLAAQAETEELQAALAAQAFRPVHGYTCERVFQDGRARVLEALQQAGLHQTAAGRAAIAAAMPATYTRPDNLTFDQRQ